MHRSHSHALKQQVSVSLQPSERQPGAAHGGGWEAGGLRSGGAGGAAVPHIKAPRAATSERGWGRGSRGGGPGAGAGAPFPAKGQRRSHRKPTPGFSIVCTSNWEQLQAVTGECRSLSVNSDVFIYFFKAMKSSATGWGVSISGVSGNGGRCVTRSLRGGEPGPSPLSAHV